MGRWDRRIVNDFLPDRSLGELPGLKNGETEVLCIRAGIPPEKCLLLHAATMYGRRGLAVALFELLGADRAPMSLDDALRLWHDLTERFQSRNRNSHTSDAHVF
jgi:hypothetical protein